MKFSELPNCRLFVIADPDHEQRIFVKDSEGNIRIYSTYEPVVKPEQDFLVQPIYLKAPSFSL